MSSASPHIGTLAESSLHAELKARLAQPGDRVEAVVAGCVIDLVRGEQLIEIQTRGFGRLRPKLARLLVDYPVQVVYPAALRKHILRLDAAGAPLSRRLSPRRGSAAEVFNELVRIPAFLLHPNFSLRVLLTQQVEVLAPVTDGKGTHGRRPSWRRRGWKVLDRQLVSIEGELTLRSRADYLAYLPPGLPEGFTSQDVLAAGSLPKRLVHPVLYTLRQCGLIKLAGKKGRFHLYTIDWNPAYGL